MHSLLEIKLLPLSEKKTNGEGTVDLKFINDNIYKFDMTMIKSN